MGQRGREGGRARMDGRKNDPDPNPTIYARLRMTSSDVGNITAIARQFHPALTAAMRGWGPALVVVILHITFLKIASFWIRLDFIISENNYKHKENVSIHFYLIWAVRCFEDLLKFSSLIILYLWTLIKVFYGNNCSKRTIWKGRGVYKSFFGNCSPWTKRIDVCVESQVPDRRTYDICKSGALDYNLNPNPNLFFRHLPPIHEFTSHPTKKHQLLPSSDIYCP